MILSESPSLMTPRRMIVWCICRRKSEILVK